MSNIFRNKLGVQITEEEFYNLNRNSDYACVKHDIFYFKGSQMEVVTWWDGNSSTRLFHTCACSNGNKVLFVETFDLEEAKKSHTDCIANLKKLAETNKLSTIIKNNTSKAEKHLNRLDQLANKHG